MFKVLLSAAGVALVAAGAVQAQDARTTWSGIYTAEQAERGAAIYGKECAPCHGASLSGVEQAPALAGDQFNSTWEGQSLADLFDRMRTTMPQTNPGSLSRAQNADILAFILRSGGFPAGERPLDGTAGALTNVTFVTYKP